MKRIGGKAFAPLLFFRPKPSLSTTFSAQRIPLRLCPWPSSCVFSPAVLSGRKTSTGWICVVTEATVAVREPADLWLCVIVVLPWAADERIEYWAAMVGVSSRVSNQRLEWISGNEEGRAWAISGSLFDMQWKRRLRWLVCCLGR